MFRYYVYIDSCVVKTNEKYIVMRLFETYSDDYDIKVVNNEFGVVCFSLYEFLEYS